MARNMQMMPTTGRGAGGKVATFLIAAVLLALIVRDPVGCAHVVRTVVVAVVQFCQAL